MFAVGIFIKTFFKIMKTKNIILLLIFFTFGKNIKAQMGISTGVFIPDVGYTANVYGPLTFRGVGFTINKYFLVETGFTIYTMPGNGITHLPFKAKVPLFGASNTLLIPLEIGFGVRVGDVSFSLSGGGFSFYNFTHRLDKGNWDRTINEYENWDVTNSTLNYENNIGFGYIWGAKIEYHVNKKLGIFINGNYLDGESPLNIVGSYSGGKLGGNITTKTANFNNAQLSIKGYEISIGATF